MYMKSSLAKDSESRLKAIFDHAIDGIISINPSGIMEDVNPAAARLFGYEREELIHQNISMLMPEPDSSHHNQYINRYLETGQRRIIGIGREVIGRRKNGTTFPFRLGISEVELEDRKIFTGVIHDLTREKEAETRLKEYSEHLETRVRERTWELAQAIRKMESVNKDLERKILEKQLVESALRDSEKLYSEIARNFPNGIICVFDRDLRFIFADGKELHIFRHGNEDLVGTRMLEDFPLEVADYFASQLQPTFEGQHTTFEIAIRNRQYIINGVPLADDDGQVHQVLMVANNVTKLKEAEEEIRRAWIKEKQLNELKSRFISIASHEFRTPLSTILSSVSLVNRYVGAATDERIDKHINRIKSNVSNLTGILDDFLSLTKLEEGKEEVRPQAFDFEAFAREVVEEMQTSAKTGQEIHLHYHGERAFSQDTRMLRNILNNLLSNAIKYSPENLPILLSVSANHKEALLKVQDKGIGIPEEEHSHMFERFFRANNASNIQGTGLGLNIVQKYLALMNGEIWFESALNKGTTFFVRIPLVSSVSS